MANSQNLSSGKHNAENDLLPEDVIRRIISFLPTVEAIRTSILSKRWRFFWTTISNLDFLDKDKDKHLESFERYVNSVLHRLDPTNSIHKLSISLFSYSRKLPDDLSNWISSAVKRNVKDLSLSICYTGSTTDVTRELFGCKSLETLRLSMLQFEFPKQGSVCIPNLVFLTLKSVCISGIPDRENSPACFPKLKSLFLNLVTYEAGGEDCVMNLIRNCPVLEDLSIKRYFGRNVSNIDLCIPQLTTVNLICRNDEPNVRVDVQIEAPVKFFKVFNWNPNNYKFTFKNPDSLIRAELDLDLFEEFRLRGQQWDGLFKAFVPFDRVKHLKFIFCEVSVFRASDIKLPMFSNLVRLEVWLNCKDLCMVENFLNNADNLQILVVTKLICRKGNCGLEFSNVPKCLTSSLKRVEIINPAYCSGEIEMVKTIRNCAKVLEKLAMKSCHEVC